MKAILKRNKPLLFLPLVLIPFIVLIFYMLGGGENPKEKDQSPAGQDTVKGANYDLPEADRSIEIIDKIEHGAVSDEITLTCDYNILGENKSDTIAEEIESSGASKTIPATDEFPTAVPEPGINPGDPGELLKHIERREQQIRSELEAGRAKEPEDQANGPGVRQAGTDVWDGTAAVETKRLTPDITLTGIDELDRVFRQNTLLARQNDSLNLKLRNIQAQSQKQEVEKDRYVTLEKAAWSGFKPVESSSGLLFKAEVYETTMVLTGNRVKLRLLEDGWLNGVKIPKGTFLYGTCEVMNERLQVTIRQIPVKDNFIPVEITVYDLDGLPGLYVPDNAARKAAKEAGGSVNTSSMFGVTGDPLTYAGIQAADRTAQSLLRTVRLKKVTIKKNTLVYLINKPR
ncbi:MAG: conjugative transposon protein TraM [Mangrovibacterium sp.]